MKYSSLYKSPLGLLLIESDEFGLTNLTFLMDSQLQVNEFENTLIKDTKKWLDIYFEGINPSFDIPLHLSGTPFQKDVWKILTSIPYGKTLTYGEIAKIIAKKKGIKRLSSQAIGQAVSSNKIVIIIPCHRVIGTNNNLTGYAYGIDKKIKLLEIEGIYTRKLKFPKEKKQKNIKRCKWCNLNNPLYVKYHDKEWCKLNLNDKYLFEMLILESFQAGLSWECVLNKREDFRKVFSNFDIDKMIDYNENDVEELLSNKQIIRNKLKIKAAINNSKIFKNIQIEYKSFHAYLKTFTNDTIIYENDKTTSPLSDSISNDLQKRGMKFVGSTIIYSYLQAIGIINSHDNNCFLYKK